MRFHADGPNIPDELLESRDRGDVVFLCGSGVSIPAGMPSFLGLAKSVFDELHVPQDAHLRSLLTLAEDESIPEAVRPSLDRIFNQLQRDYSASEVDYYVAKRLRTRPHPCVSTHKTVLRLSKGADGSPQIVTTNFDLLFQYVNRQMAHFVPPNLPDLASRQPLKGLVYLHGRINPNIRIGESRQGFVLSSSDFGRAYLAEGWATRFMRELLDRYTVVLLGYSANDPPIEYLLQGLQASEWRNREPIYAFVGETREFNQSVWDDRGVIALTYPTANEDHAALWNTLAAWADRADDPPAWRHSIVELSRNGPRDLHGHERGQVASLVKTLEGARAFADAEPPPPAEWLCVFDNTIRLGETIRAPYGEHPVYDPQQIYGLDDDSRPPRMHGDNETLSSIDLLAVTTQDPRADSFCRLAGMPEPEQIPLIPRLFRLALWIVKVSHEPVALWWAAQNRSLHPFLNSRIRLRLRQDEQDFPVPAREIWNVLIEMFQTPPSENDFSLHEISERIRVEGWTQGAVREFEESTKPRFEVKSHGGHRSKYPPTQEWAELRLSDFADIAIVFPRIQDISPNIPDEILPEVYQIGRRQLEQAVSLLGDLGRDAQESVRLHLQYNSDLMLPDDPNIFFQWFCNLLNRMVESHPKLVRADVDLWPREEPFFFDKLRLRVWSFESVFSGSEVAEELLSFNAFWDVFHRPVLLHLLRDRWQGFSLENRKQLEQRIMKGPPIHEQ